MENSICRPVNTFSFSSFLSRDVFSTSLAHTCQWHDTFPCVFISVSLYTLRIFEWFIIKSFDLPKNYMHSLNCILMNAIFVFEIHIRDIQKEQVYSESLKSTFVSTKWKTVEAVENLLFYKMTFFLFIREHFNLALSNKMWKRKYEG